MDAITGWLPSGEKGYLPYYLFIVGIVAIGNGLQNLVTLHYTRRIYNGRFVPRSSLPKASSTYNPEDSTTKLVPASATGKDVEKARDQVTPLAARLFGTWTILAGVLRIYASYGLDNPALYQLALFTHVLAAAHYTSEFLVFKTLVLSWEQAFPFTAGFAGAFWMGLQYHNYVQS